MRRISLLTQTLLFVIALLAIGCALLYHQSLASSPFYMIGSPTVAATDLPPGMTLKTYPVSATSSVPTIAFTITTEPNGGGYDVHATTTNFIISGEHLGGAPVPNEGHIHLYIDNTLIIMLGDWYHIDWLSPGDHTIRLGLFNNDHSAYEVNGQKIESSQTINATAEKSSAMASMSM